MGIGSGVCGATLDSHQNTSFKFIPLRKMAVQGERGQGGLEMCFDVGSMARDSSFYNPTANCNQWGRSPSYTEHELCRQTESHNSGAIAPQRNTEQAAINSATNGTIRGVGSQPTIQTTWSWQARQADIGGLRVQLGDVGTKVERYENYIEKVQIKLDELQKSMCARSHNN